MPVFLYVVQSNFLFFTRALAFKFMVCVEYLSPREMRMGSREGFTMRNFIVLYCSPNIVRVIKSRRLRWAGHVARM